MVRLFSKCFDKRERRTFITLITMRRNYPVTIVKTNVILGALTAAASAQLTWAPDTNLVWDLTSTNWVDGVAPSSIIWDNTGAQEAIFSDALGATVEVADGGVTVGDLTTAGMLSLQSMTDNLGRITIKGGGAIWNTGGSEIQFLNNQLNDTPLSISPGDTLTVTGGGVFDTGERPSVDNAANWSAAGATLELTEAAILRGNPRSVGQFDNVILIGGSTYVHERNTDESYANDWNLGVGRVVFGNRFNRNINLNGTVNGEGTLHVLNMGSRRVRLNNVANSFSGGVIVDSSGNRSELFVQGPGLPVSGDPVLGAVPATFDPDYLTLREGGEIKFLNMLSVDSNRGVTLDNGGVIAISGNPVTYGGAITGTGGLQIGSTVGNDANGLLLTSNRHDYTGGTTIHQGRLILGIEEALPSDTILTIGGKNSSLLVVNGFKQTFSGLNTAGNNTRQITNYDAATSPSVPTTAGTVVLSIADQADVDQEFFYGAAFGVNEATDAGNLNIVKNGEGRIALGNVRIAGSVEVNEGTLQIGNGVGFSVVGNIINEATLVIDETSTASSVIAEGGSSTTVNWHVSDWTGEAGTGFTQITIEGDAILDATSNLNIVVEEVDLVNFTESDASFEMIVVGGTTTLTPNFTLDTSGFTSGNGTWALRPDGENLFLDYTAGAAGSYTNWVAGFAGLIGGFTDDDDNDGVSNGLEYFFFNSDPTVASNLGAALSASGVTNAGEFAFTHDRPLDLSDLTVTYEWSSTLDGDWTASGVEDNGTTVTITPGGTTPAANGYETVTVTATSAPEILEKIFMRVSVSKPE